MKLRYRKFPTPVLFEDNDDYVNGSFSFNVGQKFERNTPVLVVDINLNNETLENLINQEKMVFAVSVEAGYTKYRKLIKTTESRVAIPVDIENMLGDLDINVSVVANEEVIFSSPDFNDVYEGMSFTYTKGQYAAFAYTQVFNIKGNEKSAKEAQSLIRVVKSSGDLMEVDTLGKHNVFVKLPETAFELYNQYATRPEYKEIIFSSVMLPALMQILSDFISMEESELDDFLWAKSLKITLDKLEVDPASMEDGSKSLMEVAQLIFDNPIHRLFHSIESGGEEIE